jgi:carbonic anhydrase/acetyltransferase-like protein (isoleucine patch superfamily)
MPIYALDDMKPEFPSGGDYWVAPDAKLIGRVRLLNDASVWFGCVLRGDNDWITIGERSNIQDNSVIHADYDQPTTVGAGVTVGHNVILHSCSIGDNSLIGMGSIILNRAKIGNNCLIGANTLIAEGKEIPDGSMVLGSPGRIVKQIDETQIAFMKLSAEGYVSNYRRFRDGLVRIA